MHLKVDRALPEPLAMQIERSVREQISERVLHQGGKLPSVRTLAEKVGVSVPTVVEAYNRLVATGEIVARRGSGFFVAKRRSHPALPAPVSDLAVDSHWLLSRVYEDPPLEIQAGCGWLPEQWLDTDGLKNALREVSRTPGGHLARYGSPSGYTPLRRLLQKQLASRGIEADVDQIVLTQGATQALHLVLGLLVQRGDVVAIDDPGYCNLLSLLRESGVEVVGIPRTATGPDMEALAKVARERDLTAFFTNTHLQNPTGTSYSPRTRHRAVRLAEEYDFLIVEDDIFSDLQPMEEESLASLDGLNRVIQVQSFSKTISPSLRVGYIACNRKMVAELVRRKMLCGLTSSELNERVTYAALTAGTHRTHMNQLRERLTRASARACEGLERAGMRIFHRPEGGLFVWAGFDAHCDSSAITRDAAAQGIALAPGHLFRVDGRTDPWFRFNVAHTTQPKLFSFLDSVRPRVT